MAMETVTATIRAALSLTCTSTRDFSTLPYGVDYAKSLSYTHGVGAAQCDSFFDDYRTLAGGANESLDLSGVLTDAYGGTITFARVKGLYIENTSTIDILTIGAAATPWLSMLGATGTVILRPGGYMLVAAPDATGYVVTAGTGDLLKILNGAGGTTVYRIIICGGLT